MLSKLLYTPLRPANPLFKDPLIRFAKLAFCLYKKFAIKLMLLQDVDRIILGVFDYNLL